MGLENWHGRCKKAASWGTSPRGAQSSNACSCTQKSTCQVGATTVAQEINQRTSWRFSAFFNWHKRELNEIRKENSQREGYSVSWMCLKIRMESCRMEKWKGKKMQRKTENTYPKIFSPITHFDIGHRVLNLKFSQKGASDDGTSWLSHVKRIVLFLQKKISWCEHNWRRYQEEVRWC